jgi:GTP-binding protein
LKHVERCRLLVHLIDCTSPGEGRDPLVDFATLNKELELYDAELAKKPQVVALNKVDLPEARAAAKKAASKLKRKKLKVVEVSSATGEGLAALLDVIAERLFASRNETKRRPRARSKG